MKIYEEASRGQYVGVDDIDELAVIAPQENAEKQISKSRIGKYSFARSNASKVIIGGEVSVIEKGAFFGCTNMTEVTFSENVLVIEEEAFAECVNLKVINLPKYLVRIGKHAFKGCTSLKQINFQGKKLESIEDGAFESCNQLESLVLPKSLETIGNFAFGNCINLESVNFSSLHLVTVKIPIPDVTEIGLSPFFNCEKAKFKNFVPYATYRKTGGEQGYKRLPRFIFKEVLMGNGLEEYLVRKWFSKGVAKQEDDSDESDMEL